MACGMAKAVLAPLLMVAVAYSARAEAPVPAVPEGVTGAILRLGDLHRDGSISAESGTRALDYYLGLTRLEGDIVAAIPPERLVEAGLPAEPDLDAAQKIYRKAADLGDPEAFVRLGDLALDGLAGAQDPKRAVELFRRGEIAGSAVASIRLGLMMIAGEGTAREVPGGLDRLERAAASGNGRALVHLADIARTGVPGALDANPQRAFALFQRAAETGDIGAALTAARMRIAGEGTAAAPEAGLATIRELAEAGFRDADLALGYLYLGGIAGVLPANPASAFQSFSRAAEAGSQSGATRIAEMQVRGIGTERDVARGLASLQSLADRGAVGAHLALAKLLNFGVGTFLAAEPERALKHYRKAAARGSARGAIEAARMMLEGRSGPADIPGAERMLAGLAEAGDASALLLLGELHDGEFGTSKSPDPAAAYGFYRRAAAHGSLTGRRRAAIMLARGRGVAADWDAALAELAGMAASVDAEAYLDLGDLHATAPINVPDGDAAIAAYTAAAENGVARALIRLGDLYRDGVIVDADGAAAIDYYRRAIAAGDPAGRLRVGEIYQSGEIVPYQPEEAFRLYSEAAAEGSVSAKIRIAMMSIRGEGTVRDTDFGIDALRRLVELGEAGAHVALGDVLARGLAGIVDAAEAIGHYESAADSGSVSAMMRLAELHRYGLLDRADPRRAFAYLEDAAAEGLDYALYLMGSGLTEGEFDSVRTSRKGLEALREAARRGVDEAVVGIALSHIDGASAPRNPRAGLAALSKAANAGNIAAASRLVEIYRDGREVGGRAIIRRDLTRARRAFQAISSRLPAGDRARHDFLLDVAAARRGAYDDLYDRIAEFAPVNRAGLVQAALRVDPNAFVFFAQRRLADLGHFRGRADGLMTAGSVRAVQSFCASLGAANLCRQGPLARTATFLISHAF